MTILYLVLAVLVGVPAYLLLGKYGGRQIAAAVWAATMVIGAIINNPNDHKSYPDIRTTYAKINLMFTHELVRIFWLPLIGCGAIVLLIVWLCLVFVYCLFSIGGCLLVIGDLLKLWGRAVRFTWQWKK